MGGGPAKDNLLIILPLPPPTAILDRLRKKFPEIDVNYLEAGTFDYSKDKPNPSSGLFKDATVLCTFNGLPRTLDEAPKLDYLHLFSAGSNQVQSLPLYTDSEIPITTSSGVHGPPIAEWILMTHLVHTHRYKLLHDWQKEHQWGSHTTYGVLPDRVGLRVGILGYGSIGRQVGKLAQAMGMQVVAYTATPKDSAEKRQDKGFIVPGTGDADGEIPVEWYHGLDRASLHHFLAQRLDWIVVAVPLTKETTHFLGKEEFGILATNATKTKPFVTNIARGAILNQPDLIEALKDGTLGGAALDVTDPEPLPSDSELWDLENVIVTPHVSSTNTAYADRAFQILEINLEKRRKGERLINEVRRSRGY